MRKISLLFIIFVSLWIIVPLITSGYIPTHDGEFSIIRIWQYAKILSQGYLFPRWAPDLNSGYGVPLFTFYYPLPYFIGSFLHILGLSLVDSFKLLLAISYITAILFCFVWLKKLFRTFSAAVGTFFFLSVPYWFVDLYVRGSVGEVMALASLMAIFASLEYNRLRLAGVFTATLIVSHNIGSLIFLPLILGYTFVRTKSFVPILFGLSLTAFFWIPALAEQKFVLGLSNFDFRDHFPQLAQLLIPSWGTGYSRHGWPADEMSQQLGVGIVALLILVLVYFKKVLIWPIIAGFIAFFMMLEVSIPIWNLIGPLRFIQYPWRLLSIFIPLVGFFGAYLASQNRILAIFVVIVSLFTSLQYARPVVYEPRSDEHYLSKREFTDGTTTVGNSFSTVWLTWQKDRPSQLFEKGPGESIIANISYYPGWTAIVDGNKTPVRERNGLIQFDLPAAAQKYDLRFTETPLRLLSDAISLVSLFWIVGSSILERKYAYSNRHNSTRKRA